MCTESLLHSESFLYCHPFRVAAPGTSLESVAPQSNGEEGPTAAFIPVSAWQPSWLDRFLQGLLLDAFLGSPSACCVMSWRDQVRDVGTPGSRASRGWRTLDILNNAWLCASITHPFPKFIGCAPRTVDVKGPLMQKILIRTIRVNGVWKNGPETTPK